MGKKRLFLLLSPFRLGVGEKEAAKEVFSWHVRPEKREGEKTGELGNGIHLRLENQPNLEWCRAQIKEKGEDVLQHLSNPGPATAASISLTPPKVLQSFPVVGFFPPRRRKKKVAAEKGNERCVRNLLPSLLAWW